MVGAHSYCFVTGGHFLLAPDYFIEEVLEECFKYKTTVEPGEVLPGCPLPQEVVDGLWYSEDDVEASQRYVMVCGYERDAMGKMKLLAQFEDQVPERPGPDNVTAVFNVVPDSDHELGGYYNEDPPDGDPGQYCVFSIAPGPTMIITQRSYVILRQACPRLEPHILFRLNSHVHINKLTSKEIDYGPLNGFQQRWVYWPSIVQEGEPYPLEPIWKIWRDMLLDSSKTTNEILHNAWRGAGNMWLFVSPDRFPIANVGDRNVNMAPQWNIEIPTTSVFPLSRDVLLLIAGILHPRDIASLMNSSRSMRLILFYPAQRIVQRYIQQFEPWFLPAGPFEFPRGDKEVNFWNSEWEKVGYHEEDLDAVIPWLDYRRECSHSLSMWSRIRTWRMVQQIDSLADRLGYYEPTML